MVCSFYPDATSQTSRSSSSLVLGLDDVARGTPTRSLGIEDDDEGRLVRYRLPQSFSISSQ
jgi:hypothetical protein